MNQRTTYICAALMGLTGVLLGAFGAHGLKAILTLYDTTTTYKLAVEYQFYHTFALLAVAFVMSTRNEKLLRYAALCFLLGIFFFSGSLYVLALTNVKILGAITPIGGVFFIAGWFLFLLTFIKQKHNN